jgi:phospholipid-translocating ATPase
LQTLKCPRLLRNYRSVAELEKFKARVECDPPSVDLYTYNGKVELLVGDKKGEAEALDADNLLLRGSKIKNTEYIYGIYMTRIKSQPDYKIIFQKDRQFTPDKIPNWL